MNGTIIKTNGGTDCRICGLRFDSELPTNQRIHREEHQRLIRGGLPLRVRELMMDYGKSVALRCRGLERLKSEWSDKVEAGKLAMVFSHWAHARGNGIPDDQFDSFTAAHLAWIDAQCGQDERATIDAEASLTQWSQFLG